MIYPINDKTRPVNDLVLIEIYRTKTEKTVGQIQLTQRETNNDVILGKVKSVGHIIEKTGLIKAGDWIMFDKFSLFGKPSLESGTIALVPAQGIIAIVDME